MRKESTEDAQQEFKQGKYTQANAFQHALWMYRVTMEFDDEIAETYGDAYERSVENPLSERMMNLYNNGVGICLAQYNNTSIINDTAVIYDAFTKGLLMTTVKNNFEDLEFTCEFRLFTKHNPTKYQVITRSKLALSNFNNSRDSKFIVHGWTRNNKSNPWAWMISMKDELLKYSDYNVFLVDWNDGAKYWWYYRSADNTDEAGRQIFEFIRMLKDERGYDECKVHLIGHSLGAQVSGAAGRRIPTIGRITGLDPAKQSFHEKGAFRQLDASDAQFVDIVHTDSMLGCQTPIGDVDFYPNGGNGQPGCGFKMPGCDHGRAIIYFSESINNVCSYKSYPCSLKRKCSSCGNGCNRMGFHATKTPNGTFYLETNSKSVYCKA
ncbi:inactive pancreatic lipase-related protein 1-like [Glandiceps talaboti]